MSIEQTKTISTQDNRAIALRYMQDGFGNLKVWDEVVSPNFVRHFCGIETIRGIEAVKEFEMTLFTGFPDAKQTIEDVMVEGNKVAIRLTLQGTHTGNFMGIPPTGKSITSSGLFILHLSNHQVLEEWVEFNLLHLMQQLGAIPD